MNKRRDFLKKSIPLCIGIGIGGFTLSCNRIRRTSKVNNQEAEDYFMTAYCTLPCDKCDAYLATINMDENLKIKVAEHWGMKPEEIYCKGCKSDNALFSCSASKCAEERGVITCAHCEDFVDCDNELWNKQPQLRKMAEELRKTLAGQES